MTDQITTVGYCFRQWHIPARMMGGLQHWIEDGIPPGDFLYSVLCNDLMKACQAADDENLDNLPAYAAYLYNEAPSQCHGSPEKVRAWAKKFLQEDEK